MTGPFRIREDGGYGPTTPDAALRDALTRGEQLVGWITVDGQAPRRRPGLIRRLWLHWLAKRPTR
jgi:hypothetical protein